MLKQKAYAKINLFLDVLRKRDDGYHDIGTMFQTINLYDELEAELIENDEIEMKYAEVVDFALEDDLIYKAAMALKAKTACKKGISFKLTKNLPMGAGLGGGSADCATALRMMNQLWKLGLDFEELAEIGATLGADVPFMIEGGSALAEGIGEKLQKVDLDLKNIYVLVLTPNAFVSTADAYARLKPSGSQRYLNFVNHISAGKDFWSSKFDCFNKFEESVFELFPEINKIANQLSQNNAKRVMLSGSGASVLGFYNDKSKAEQVLKLLESSCRYAKMAELLDSSIN